ncbi:hypothetical protein GIB67_039783, partial [Kingdonia uniflora]
MVEAHTSEGRLMMDHMVILHQCLRIQTCMLLLLPHMALIQHMVTTNIKQRTPLGVILLVVLVAAIEYSSMKE